MTNSRKAFLMKREKENYFKQAKKIHVRARSYFKLEQIQTKFRIIKENINIMDLGCSPGGWLEFLDKNYKNIKVVGIDLLEIKKQKEFSTKIKIIEDDFLNIKEYNLEKFDLILSDMAPEFSGDSKLDRGKTHNLNFLTLDFSKTNLKENGNLVFKSFEGEDLDNVLKIARKLFNSIKVYKPRSSKKISLEVFIICFNKLKLS